MPFSSPGLTGWAKTWSKDGESDEYFVFKPTLKTGKRAIFTARLETGTSRWSIPWKDDATTKNVAVTLSERRRYVSKTMRS